MIIVSSTAYLFEVMPLVNQQTVSLLRGHVKKEVDGVVEGRFWHFPPPKKLGLGKTARMRVHPKGKEFYP